ncbi:MAG: hypothetical protein R3324_00400, partial [Halobacteriales archaeon]|nr:hypothetical protein [Halobacteriales archaeon]
MSVATETAPKRFVKLVLDASAEGSWSNAEGKPDRIVFSSRFSPREKASYERSNALYVYQVGESDKRALDGSGDAYEEVVDVAVDLWCIVGEDLDAVAEDLADDVEDVMNAYWTDNAQNTA